MLGQENQMISVIKLFAFVEIGYFVLGIQLVFLAEKEADEEKHFCYGLA